MPRLKRCQDAWLPPCSERAHRHRRPPRRGRGHRLRRRVAAGRVPRIDPDARFSFAGSNQLQRQIERGAPADVFASASPAEPRELRRKGLCDAPRTFATNTLVMIVPAANRARVRSVYELRRGNLRVAIGTAAVPVGAYTRQVLRRLGLTSALRANSVSEEPSVQGISAKVALGSADVGFVYATDARIVRDRTDALRLPASAQPPVRSRSAWCGAGARIAPARAPSCAGCCPIAAGACCAPRDSGSLRARPGPDVLRRVGFGVLMGACLLVVVAFFAVPIIALFLEVPPADVPDLLGEPLVRDTIAVTARTNAMANVLILAIGTPAAYLLATRRFRGRALLLTIVELPLVLPPAVAGIGLLAAFGAGGLVGDDLSEAGIVLPFTEWAVVLAVMFVASPFYVRQAVASFEGVDRTLSDAARTLGASPARTFWRVALPLAASGLVAGWVLAFARGIGEFGATIVFAGSVRGETQTLPLAIYEQLDADFDAALAIGILLVVLSATVLLAYKGVTAWRGSLSMSR